MKTAIGSLTLALHGLLPAPAAAQTLNGILPPTGPYMANGCCYGEEQEASRR